MNTRLVKLPRMAYYYGSDEVDCIALTGRRDVAPTGDPTEIKVVSSLGKGLDQKAVECLQKWHFKPARTQQRARVGEGHNGVQFPPPARLTPCFDPDTLSTKQ